MVNEEAVRVMTESVLSVLCATVRTLLAARVPNRVPKRPAPAPARRAGGYRRVGVFVRYHPAAS